MKKKFLATATLCVSMAASTAWAATIDVLHVGGHSSNYAQSGSINVTQVNGTGLNSINLADFDVIYADEHASYGSRTTDVSNAIQNGDLAFVGGLPYYASFPVLNSILGTNVSRGTGALAANVTAAGASSQIFNGVNVGNLLNGTRSGITGSGWSSVLATNQTGDPLAVEGRQGAGGFVLFGLEPMEYNPNSDEISFVRNAVNYAASLNVAPVPVPAALPLLAMGLGALGLAGRRKKKRAAYA